MIASIMGMLYRRSTIYISYLGSIFSGTIMLSAESGLSFSFFLVSQLTNLRERLSIRYTPKFND